MGKKILKEKFQVNVDYRNVVVRYMNPSMSEDVSLDAKENSPSYFTIREIIESLVCSYNVRGE